MRVLIIQPWIRAGGAELLSLELAAELEAAGDSAPIATLFVDLRGLPALAANRTYILPSPRLSRAFARSRALTFLAGPFVLLWLVLRSGRDAGVLNPHNVPAPVVAALAGPLLGRPVVWTCNEVPERLTRQDARAVGALDTAIWRVASLLARPAARVAREILVLSEKTQHDVRNRYGRDATVVRPGIDLTTFGASHAGTRDPFALLFVAKLHPQKDPLLAVRCLAALRARGVEAQLTIVGDGPLRTAVDELADALGVAPSLRIERHLLVEELVERYRSSDVLLVTSGGHQSWGLTPFEAIAAGTPTIMSDEIGAAEVLGAAGAALVVPRSAESFADAAIRLRDDPALSIRLVENGRRASASMTWRRYAERSRAAFDDATRGFRPWGGVDGLVWTVAALALAIYAAQLVFFFGRFPLPWPDETLYAEPGLKLIRDGVFGSPLYEGPSLGAAQHVYWLPPGYFLLVAAAFAISGPTLEAIRAVSVGASLLTLALTASLVRRIGGARAAAVAVALLALDPLFVRASLVGRTDLPALALVLAALWLGLRPGTRSEIGAGMAAASATLIHPLGLVAFLVLAVRPIVGSRSRPAYVLAGASLPLLATAAYALQDPASVVQQLSLQLDRKGARGIWDLGFALRVVVDQYGGSALGVAPVFAWLAGAWGLALRSRRAPVGWLLLLALLVEVTAINLSAEMWYPAYVLPFAYAGVGCGIERLFFARGPAKRLRASRSARAVVTSAAVAGCVMLFVLDADALGYRWRATAPVATDAYSRWSAAVAQAIPAGAHVLIGGAPDPSWALLVDRPDVELRAILDTPSVYAYYATHLADLDYAVVSSVVSPAWIELVASRASAVTEIVGPAGAIGGACIDGWTPCRTLVARVYRLRAH